MLSCVKILLLVMTICQYNCELIPLPKGRPNKAAPFTIVGEPGVALHFVDWSDEQAAYWLFLSKGFGVTSELRQGIQDNMDGVKKFIAESKLLTQDSDVILPIYTSDAGTIILQYHMNDDPATIVRNFVVSNNYDLNEESRASIVNQLRIRMSRIQHQIDAFQPPPPIAKDSNCSVVRNSMSREIPSVDSLTFHDDFPVFVINMWDNHARREYMAKQLSEYRVYLMPGIDAISIPAQVMSAVIHPKKIMIQSHLAAAIAHIQTWQEVAAKGISMAVALEDDMFFTQPLNCVILKTIATLPEDWSILYLDYSDEQYWDEAHRKYSDVRNKCVGALKNTNASVVQLGGVCSSGSTRAYVISHRGARTLLRHALPIWRNADVFLRDMIYDGIINAYALVKPIATAQLQLQKPSQMSERSIRIDPKTNKVVLTYRPHEAINCEKEICPVEIILSSEL